MKLFFLILVLATAVLAAPRGFEPISLNYHENYGIPEAARIKASEEATDFDGSRIVGGSFSSVGQFPFFGGLVVTLASGATSVCGSSLLSNTRAVTAAHCWTDGRQNARQVVVVFASITLFSGGTRVTSSNVQLHASYNNNNMHNDIAMIILPSVGFNNNIRAIARATGTNTFAGSTATACGFGRTGDNVGIGTNQRLSHVNLPVITNAVCAQTFGTSIIIASTLCVSGANGRSTCQGDSGGPLVVGNQLVGITSFGAAAGCARGFPAAFARVTSFAAWINARV